MVQLAANLPSLHVVDRQELHEHQPEIRLSVYEEHARSILATNDRPGVSFHWGVNPYRGCRYACAYDCELPAHGYLGLGAGTDFDSRITVKVNAPELLDAELAESSMRRERIAFSGATDCYQPLEAVYQLTRKCLEVCLRRATPVGIVTKAHLVLRDLELLVELNRRVGATVFVSIPFADDARAHLIEGEIPSSSRRFEVLRRLSEAGVPTGIMLAPIVPGLNDRDIPTLLERAAQCGAKRAGFTAMHLPESVLAVFLSRLRTILPQCADRIEAGIQNSRGGAMNDARFNDRMNAEGPYWQSVARLFEMMATRFDLNAGQRWLRDACEQPDTRQLPLFS